MEVEKEDAVKLSNPAKLYFPEDGISKQQVFEYYARNPQAQAEIRARRWDDDDD